jgi:hypothetical protein
VLLSVLALLAWLAAAAHVATSRGAHRRLTLNGPAH